MRSLLSAALLCLAVTPATARAQSLAARIAAGSGKLEVVYPSRPDACGDGETFIGHVFGSSTYRSGNTTFSGHGAWSNRPCVHGPARVVASVSSGEISSLRVYVGPLPAGASSVRRIDASAADAAAWLGDVVSRGPSDRLASDAMLPLLLADGVDGWPILLRAARDDARPRGVRSAALTWLAMGATERLGLSDQGDDTDDDEVRSQAVFALSRRPRSESVPELIDIIRTAKNRAARRSAVFWLGQTGDQRAVDFYADVLARR